MCDFISKIKRTLCSAINTLTDFRADMTGALDWTSQLHNNIRGGRFLFQYFHGVYRRSILHIYFRICSFSASKL